MFCLADTHAGCARFRQRTREPVRSGTRPRSVIISLLLLGGACVAGAVVTAFVVGNPLSVEPEPATATVAAVAPAPSAPASVAPAEGTSAPAQAPATIAPGQQTVAPRAATVGATPLAAPLYTVQSGDSLTSVAERYGVSVEALAAANSLSPTARLDVGDRLIIPVAALRGSGTPLAR